MISECRNRIKKNAQDAKAECFLCIFCFFIGNFSFPIKKKTLREDAHLAEKKLAANSTARARKSRKRLFVLWSFFNIVFATLLDNDFSVCLLWLWQTLMEIPDSTQAPILAMR